MEGSNYVQLAGPIFEAVQQATPPLFPDSKTFVDSTPRLAPPNLLKRFQQEQSLPSFNLKRFVTTYFDLPAPVPLPTSPAYSGVSMTDYIEALWPQLIKPMVPSSPYSTLIALPFPHPVPGGRFTEAFYWDSYFTALGLIASSKVEQVKQMVLNFCSLIDRFGFIPNGNRVYFLSRSQPPVFSLLVELLIQQGAEDAAIAAFPFLKREYHFWMTNSLSHVELSSRGLPTLNRYFDRVNDPRPEAYRQEQSLAQHSADPLLFQQLRTACASGWDFSSRFLEEPTRLDTVCALNILPIDLNCLLYHYERLLGQLSHKVGEDPHDYTLSADKRQRAISTLFWSETKRFFFDYHIEYEQLTTTYSLAALWPLFMGIATAEQAAAVAHKVETSFLCKGGFVTTLTPSPHQWDYPNGWAPLQWITIAGLRRYGYDRLASQGSTLYLQLNESCFLRSGNMLERYNVVDPDQIPTGGEYPLQDGFGWTNGVALALMSHHPLATTI